MLEPLAGYVDDPMLAARNVAHAARAAGAKFRFHQEVIGIELAGGRVTGIHHRALRQEVFAVPAPAGLTLDDGTPIVSDPDIGQYFRPQAGGTLLVGGVEPPCDELEWIEDPDQFDEHPTVARFETTMYRLAHRLPGFGVPHRPTGLAALYDVSDDWVPIYDGSSLPGYFMACGTSGNQFKNAPMVGRFMVALIDAAVAGRHHDDAPVGIVGPRTGRTIDLGAFSRLRPPSPTSGTVMG